MVDVNFFSSIANFTIEEIASLFDAKILNCNDSKKTILSLAALDEAGSNELAFLSNAKYADSLGNCKAAVCFIADKFVKKAPESLPLLVVQNPYYSWALLASKMYQSNNRNNFSAKDNISSAAKIGENCVFEPNIVICDGVQIGNNCFIGANSYIGNNVKLGNNCTIGQNVTITHSLIGDNAHIMTGARIGQDGFGFAFEQGKHFKVPQLGRVIIGNNVDIGSNSCIDRGSINDTIIGDGTIIDNLVQIAHNVKIGKHCVIVSQVGISGSTKLADYVVLGGQVGVAGHLEIGTAAQVAAQSGIAKNIDAKQVVGGSPAMPIRKWHRQNSLLRKLVDKNTENYND